MFVLSLRPALKRWLERFAEVRISQLTHQKIIDGRHIGGALLHMRHVADVFKNDPFHIMNMLCKRFDNFRRRFIVTPGKMWRWIDPLAMTTC